MNTKSNIPWIWFLVLIGSGILWAVLLFGINKAFPQADPRTGMALTQTIKDINATRPETRTKHHQPDPLVSRREVCEKAREVLEVAKDNATYWCE